MVFLTRNKQVPTNGTYLFIYPESTYTVVPAKLWRSFTTYISHSIIDTDMKVINLACNKQVSSDGFLQSS